jgi:hypothetical protein
VSFAAITLCIASDVDLKINAEKTKYMIMSRHPNSGQNQNIRIANESFEKVEKFKYLGTILTNHIARGEYKLCSTSENLSLSLSLSFPLSDGKT